MIWFRVSRFNPKLYSKIMHNIAAKKFPQNPAQQQRQNHFQQLMRPIETAKQKIRFSELNISYFFINLPIPPTSCCRQRRQIVFEQVQTHSLDIMIRILHPVHVTHIEIKHSLVGERQAAPQALNIVVREHPFVGAKVRNDVAELVDFLVHF